jgi:predicted dehydrogenase
MEKPPVFGIIGTGFIGRMHLKALGAAGFTVGAFADPSAAALEAAAELAPGARRYENWRELLGDPAITAVNICTRNAMHLELLKAAVASGRHVFCEKTMTINATQAREALTLRPAPGQAVQIGYMKRFFPNSVWAKERLREIGEPICSTVRSFQGGLADEGMFDSADWRPTADGPSRTRVFASGGMLNMAGSHMLDMTAWLLGTPRTVSCRTWAPAGYDAELQAHALFQMESGALTHFEAALSPFSRTGVYENGWDEFIQIDGRKGRLELYYPLWDKPADFPSRGRIYLEAKKEWEEPMFPAVNAFQLELEAFAECCQAGRTASPAIRDGAVVDCWIDACYESAAQGREAAFSL